MKLLHKTVSSYIIYALVIMLIAVPLFYLITSNILSREIDIRLLSQKASLLEKIRTLTNVTELRTIEPDAQLELSNDPSEHDTLYSIRLLDTRISRIIPYRILQTNVTIKKIRYKIQLKSSLVENNDLLKNIVLLQFVLMVVITTGLLFISRILSKKLWRPFYVTLKKLQLYKMEGEQLLTFDTTDIDEFDYLNNTLSALTKRNVDVYQSQKEFTENASHEMQSPLAVSQSKIELLMQTTPLSKEQAELIGALSDAGNRMSRLNKSLFLLSKIDNNQFPDKERLDAAEVMDKILDQYQTAVVTKDISLNLTRTEPVILNANRTLMEVLFTNLVTNAIRHNIKGGILNIDLDNKQFVIENSAAGSALQVEKLFRRFQKQTTEQRSLGLGLEIVKRICNLNGFLIRYTFEEGKHRFRVEF